MIKSFFDIPFVPFWVAILWMKNPARNKQKLCAPWFVTKSSRYKIKKTNFYCHLVRKIVFRTRPKKAQEVTFQISLKCIINVSWLFSNLRREILIILVGRSYQLLPFVVVIQNTLYVKSVSNKIVRSTPLNWKVNIFKRAAKGLLYKKILLPSWIFMLFHTMRIIDPSRLNLNF